MPDISKWDVSRNLNLSNLFTNCSQLTSLPDLSRWDTFNVMNMGGLFKGCYSLSSIFDISKWKTGNVRYNNNCLNLYIVLGKKENFRIKTIEEKLYFYEHVKIIIVDEINYKKNKKKYKE